MWAPPPPPAATGDVSPWQYRSSGGSRPTTVASDVSPADRPIRRHEQARAPKGSRTRRPCAAWLSPQQEAGRLPRRHNFGLARPTRGQQLLQHPAKSNDEGEEEDGDGKSVDSFDSDATPPADDDIVLGGDTGDGELEEPLHEGEEVGEEGKEEQEEQEEEAQPRGGARAARRRTVAKRRGR
ncbi:hypothetical protein THAOC_19666 [Thalassiosira oceanica]|uniref:Uncharacterized protein n=1 Tax=Thalassiosira oceanica TaxID=159749 RepID=K0S595_THAOC|nr:hypothetical protein THAOC_19666 [Thalassiosira oceanica]|eukprot:EJK60054.1 hypothetical protein THAOC_19666 [Thalassiosira oceanica]